MCQFSNILFEQARSQNLPTNLPVQKPYPSLPQSGPGLNTASTGNGSAINRCDNSDPAAGYSNRRCKDMNRSSKIRWLLDDVLASVSTRTPSPGSSFTRTIPSASTGNGSAINRCDNSDPRVPHAQQYRRTSQHDTPVPDIPIDQNQGSLQRHESKQQDSDGS